MGGILMHRRTMPNNYRVLRNILSKTRQIEVSQDMSYVLIYAFLYKYASDLIRDIKEQSDLCIGGACYPEGHIECKHKEDDIIHLKEKVEAGCDFLTTQMFFDNNILYNFLYRIREKGITVPVLAGIMPITNARQLERSVALSGTHVPQRFRAIVDKFGDNPPAMKQAGIVYAAGQIIDLIANGITHIHVYSMNKPEVAAGILSNLSSVLR